MSESKRDELDRIKAEGCHQYIMTDYCRRLKELRSPVEEIDTAYTAGFDKCREILQKENKFLKEIADERWDDITALQAEIDESKAGISERVRREINLRADWLEALAGIAETKEVMMAGMNKLSDAAEIYKYRCDQLHEDIKPLLNALEVIEYDSCDYNHDEIASNALADFQKKYPAT